MSEEEYINKKIGQQQKKDFQRRQEEHAVLAGLIDPANCYCKLTLADHEIRSKGPDSAPYVVRIHCGFLTYYVRCTKWMFCLIIAAGLSSEDTRNSLI
jgi:hypothetical protein